MIFTQVNAGGNLRQLRLPLEIGFEEADGLLDALVIVGEL
jgi:hypothetical protein